MARPKDPQARASLIAAARREFVRVGIQRARIEDITRACGLSKGAFYLHFASKEALFRELVGELEARFGVLRAKRAEAWSGLIARGLPGRKDPTPFVDALIELEGVGDLQLLELLWSWRDVVDVLLRSSQGTEFEGVIWKMLDRELSRVEGECAEMKAAGLVRADVNCPVLALTVVGTQLLMARSFATLTEKPDLRQWLQGQYAVLLDGLLSAPLRVHRERAAHPHRRAPRGARSVPARQRRG